MKTIYWESGKNGYAYGYIGGIGMFTIKEDCVSKRKKRRYTLHAELPIKLAQMSSKEQDVCKKKADILLGIFIERLS